MVDKRSKNRFLNIFVVKTWSRNKYITIKAPELNDNSSPSSGACLFGTPGSQPNAINSKAPIPIISHFGGCGLQQGNSSNHVYPQKIFHKSGKKYSSNRLKSFEDIAQCPPQAIRFLMAMKKLCLIGGQYAVKSFDNRLLIRFNSILIRF